jgi:hypothetical protein
MYLAYLYHSKNVAVHARSGKQLYKGGVHLDAFQTCIDQSQKLYVQRKWNNCNKFKEMQERFPSIDHWMIGRGLPLIRSYQV